MQAYIQPLLDWVALNQTWAGLAVFLLSVAESLLIVGLVIPGTIVMFGVGALVATGVLNLWETLGWAALGAVVGDGISFWIGHYFKDRLRGMWPLKRYPGLVSRGEGFFLKHGGKSVLFGRFVGPVRPVIPTIAGMMGMSPAHFTVVNVVSALIWAPAYILPGVVFGASMGLASEVASRLAIWVVGLVAVLWLTVWGVRRLYIALQPRASAMLVRAVAWGHKHPVLGNVTGAVFDPDHPELKGLFTLAGVLLLASAAFAWLLTRVLASVVTDNPLTYIDRSIAHFMQGLRTPWADQVMVLVSGLGDALVVGSLALAMLAWLAWRRCWFATVHWVAAVSLGALLPLILQLILHVPRPEAIYSTLATLGFPSGSITVNMAMYGFLSVLVARELPGPQRWLPYAMTGVLMTSIVLSHLYLGIGSLSDTVGGLTLGLAWTALLGIAYVRHASPSEVRNSLTGTPGKLPVGGTMGVVISVLLLSGAWHLSGQYEENLQRYAPRYVVRMLDQNDWWTQQWQGLPAYRIDFGGRPEQPLTVQWAGSLPMLRAHLEAQGWHAPAPLNVAGVLNWLSPTPAIGKLPILPQVHDGRQEALVLVHEGVVIDPRPGAVIGQHPGAVTDPRGVMTGPRPGAGAVADRYLVLRLWPSDVKLGTSRQNLWVGNVTSVRMKHPLPLFTVPLGENVFNGPLHDFQPFLKGLAWRTVRRPVPPTPRWDGSVMLMTMTPTVQGSSGGSSFNAEGEVVK